MLSPSAKKYEKQIFCASQRPSGDSLLPSTKTLKYPCLLSQRMEEQVFDLLLKQEDISWKGILQELVRTEQMDPWNIDLMLLARRYIQVIREMQEHDFRISGKILLAAAFLLKLKATYLVEHDISNLDKLISQTETADEEELFEELAEGKREKLAVSLIPRTPQPRTRKVSIHDLIEALQRAMESKKRVLAKYRPATMEFSRQKIDILGVIRELYHKIAYYAEKDKKDVLPFSRLLPPRAGKREKVYTFVPLLHLEHQRKVETSQEKPFEEIYVKLLKKKG